MDPTTIGQQLKAKYPQYAQYPDAVLGQRWIDVNVKKPAAVGAQYTPDFNATTSGQTQNANQQAPNLASAESQVNNDTGMSAPLMKNEPSAWDKFMGFLGATPKQGQEENTGLGSSLSGYDLNNVKIPLK